MSLSFHILEFIDKKVLNKNKPTEPVYEEHAGPTTLPTAGPSGSSSGIPTAAYAILAKIKYVIGKVI